MLRSVPNSKEAEQAVLSAMFLSKSALDKVFEAIDENAFYPAVLHEEGVI